jgi:hypothetical protein
MTIYKAIEILADLMTTLPQRSPEERREAVKLGMEALIAIRTGRKDYYEAGGHLLQGETKDKVKL